FALSSVVLALLDCQDLLSFPTRRSSDLRRGQDASAVVVDLVAGDALVVGSTAPAQRDRRVGDNTNSEGRLGRGDRVRNFQRLEGDRKSTRLNSSHVKISYAVFYLKTKLH